MEDLKTPNIAVENDDRTISVQVLEFKTSLLEAVEELHIHRDAETRYEQQICKLVLEKQELEWQKESLQSQISRTSSENSESLAAVKKQFQAQIRRIEGEKGKTQLAAELKDKEITSLKEELKLLQLLRYSLEKKLGELEQKLQLQTQTKDSHLNQLGEVERRFSAVSKQCAMVKQAHEKLEQNVEEAMRINKKLTSINETQASTIKALKEDVERLNKQRITSKVSSVCKHGEEHLHSVLKDQQLQNLQQRLCVETELNKKLQNEISLEREEKQEVLRSLHHTQRLLQMQTEALSHVEQELNTLLEEHKTLKTEHELNQERTQEKEDRFAQLRDEYQNSKLAWEKEMLLLQKMKEADQVELKTVKEAYNQLQEECKALSLSAVYKARDIHNSQYDLKTQETSFSTPVGEINLIRVGLHKDESVDCKERLIRPNDIYEPTSHPVKGIPDESNAECQTTRQDGCSHSENRELNVPTHSDQTVPVPSPSEEPDHSVSDLSDEILRHEQASAKVTNQLSDETKTGVSESEPVCNAVDKRCPSNIAPSDIDNCLSQLSGPETRSVYEVDGDPLASEPKDRVLEQSLCIPEVTEPQTSDKHIDSQGCATSQYTESKEVKNQTGAPESLYSHSQMENRINAERILEEKTSNPQNTPVFCDITPITDGPNAAQPSPGLKTIQQKPEIPLDSTVSLDTCLLESKDDFSLPALACPLLHSQVSKAEVTQAIGPYDGANIVESKQLPLVADNTEPSTQTTKLSVEIEVDSVEAISENANQKDNDSTFASSTQTLKDQQSKAGVSSDKISSHLKITNPQIQDPASPSDGLPKANDQSNVDQKCISVVDASRHGGHKEYWSSFPWGKFIRGKKDPQPRSVDSDVDRSVVSKNSQPSMSLTSSTPSAFEQKSSGFHELVAPFCAPLFTKDKVTKTVMMKTPDKLDTPSKHPHQRAIVEWNAIKQSFSEILPEKENQVLISYSSTLSGSTGSSSVGNGLQQVCTPSVSPPKLQSLEKDGYPTAKRGTSDGKEERKQSDIMAQIAKIKEFMSSEGLMPQKRPKID